jgi:hypothetical protein
MSDPRDRHERRSRTDHANSTRSEAGTGTDSTADAESTEPAEITDADRRRRRALFLRELSEAKALRERVEPRRARAARMRQQMRMRTFR